MNESTAHWRFDATLTGRKAHVGKGAGLPRLSRPHDLLWWAQISYRHGAALKMAINLLRDRTSDQAIAGAPGVLSDRHADARQRWRVAGYRLKCGSMDRSTYADQEAQGAPLTCLSLRRGFGPDKCT